MHILRLPRKTRAFVVGYAFFEARALLRARYCRTNSGEKAAIGRTIPCGMIHGCIASRLSNDGRSIGCSIFLF
jgi:hypothetical protein